MEVERLSSAALNPGLASVVYREVKASVVRGLPAICSVKAWFGIAG